MDTREAQQVLAKELETYRAKSYAELGQIIGGSIDLEKIGPSGAHYQIEIEVWWDGRPKGAVRVVGSIFLIVWSLDSFGFRSPIFAFLVNPTDVLALYLTTAVLWVVAIVLAVTFGFRRLA